MSDTTKTKQGDTLRTQNIVEETPNSNSLIDTEELPNTPFKIIYLEDKCFIVMGDYRLTPTFDNKQQVIEYYETHKWEITINIILIVIDHKKLLQKINDDH